MKRWLILIVVLLVGLVLAVFMAGAMLPVKHSVSRSITIKQPPEEIWAAITNHADDPRWRPDVESVSRIADRNGHAVWEEKYKNGQTMHIETTVVAPPGRMERKIVDQSAFGGVWVYEVSTQDDPLKPGTKTTTLKITENGEVYNPAFRFIGRFVIGNEATVETYLKNLAMKYGETVDFKK